MGYIFEYFEIPMAFLVGGLITTSILVKPINSVGNINYLVPNAIRYLFFGIIGCTIGAGFRGFSDYLNIELLFSFFLVVCFVCVCQYFNYIIFRLLGRYDKITAFFCGTPGGLIESIEAGEQHGGDVKIITVHHFLRVIVVVLLVPLFFFFFFDTPKGFEDLSPLREPMDYNLGLIFSVAIAGLFLAYWVPVPAKYFVCPLALSATLSATDIVYFSCPDWLMFTSQLIVGIALGAKLLGINFLLLKKCLFLSILTSFSMLIMAFFLSLLLGSFLNISNDIFFISLVPGGVSEMSLMAVVLSSDATFVTIHHLWRIIVVVIEIVILKRLNIFKSPKTRYDR